MPTLTVEAPAKLNLTLDVLGRRADEAYAETHADRLRPFSDLERGHWAYFDIVEAANGHTYSKSGGTERWTGLN